VGGVAGLLPVAQRGEHDGERPVGHREAVTEIAATGEIDQRLGVLACLAVATGGEPELDASKLAAVTLYTQALAVPARRDVSDPAVMRGATLFREARCVACHVETLRSADEFPALPLLARQTFHPYTDLLLHDLGAGLADGRPDFLATGREWRTAPLWGTGLIEAVNRHTYLLHDGRARGHAEAILWHDGEARASRDAFRAMPRADRDALLTFLRSL
jgi:CxxC motif-containing protein (DUF1111 family)